MPKSFFPLLLSAFFMAQSFHAGIAEPLTGDYANNARALLDPYVQSNLFSGAVLVAHDGKAIFRQAFGQANREWDIANTSDTRFRLGSITKQFTATAILQLAEQHKLSIDDPVSKYYAEAPAAWQKITIKYLLTHSSGIPSYTDIPDFFKSDARIDRTPEEIVKLTRDKPLQFEPGSQFAYDNSGYVLLGYIIEKVSGESYADYLQKHIFDPLGMHNSGYDSSTKIILRRAAGYENQDGEWVNGAFLSMSIPYAAGALYSTADDLLIWDQALYAAKPLNDASLKQMFTDYGHTYGFGWFIDRKLEHNRISHGGSIKGFQAEIDRYPDDRLTIIVLSNFGNSPVDKISTDLAALYFGVKAPVAITLSTEVLDHYVGQYELSPGIILKIKREGNRLFIQKPGQSLIELFAKNEMEFFLKVADAQISFQTDDKGKVIGLINHQAGLDHLAKLVDATEAAREENELKRRVKDQAAQPGSEDALRRTIETMLHGEPNYDQMGLTVAAATRQQFPKLKPRLATLGALQSISFKGVSPGGADIYEATFANGLTEWRILLGPDGKIVALGFRPLS
ncbi:MAG: serine hydrolase [Pseudomonadota bacterium]